MVLKVKNTTSFPFSSVLPLLFFANTPLSASAFSFSLLESFLLEYWALLLLANLDLLFSVNIDKMFEKSAILPTIYTYLKSYNPTYSFIIEAFTCKSIIRVNAVKQVESEKISKYIHKRSFFLPIPKILGCSSLVRKKYLTQC